MGEIIKLLKQQIDICRRLLASVEEQRKALCEGSGPGMGSGTKRIEQLLAELRRIEKRQGRLLQGTGTRSLAELLDRTAVSPQRSEAQGLLQECGDLMHGVREAVEMNSILLDRHMQFIMFNINVMAGVTADPTYKAEKNKRQPASDNKMFDASV